MKPTTLTSAQKLALVATLSTSLGTAGGAIVQNYTDKDLLQVEEIVQLQETKEVLEGDYQQYLKGGVVPESEEKLSTIPETTHVDVYEGPTGKGYVIVQEFEDRTVYLGYGPEAAERTVIEMKPMAKATTSKEIKI